MTSATTGGWFGTWVGWTLGIVAADALAIAVGALLGRRLSEKAIKVGAAVPFFAFGAALTIEGLVGSRAQREPARARRR